MLHPDRSRLRCPALAMLAMAAAASVQAQDAAPPRDAAAVVSSQGGIVGGGIGYGVDAERQGDPVVSLAPRDAARRPPADSEGAAPWQHSRRGYVGLGVGQSAFDTDCGVGAFACKGARPALHLFAGSAWNDTFGLELGYRYLGRARRGGGHTEAQSLGLSLVGQLPLGPLSLFAKAGAAYGRTRVSAEPASRLPTGQAAGWSGTWGAGLGWEMSPASALVLEWASAKLPIAGAGRTAIETTSIGFLHHF